MQLSESNIAAKVFLVDCGTQRAPSVSRPKRNNHVYMDRSASRGRHKTINSFAFYFDAFMTPILLTATKSLALSTGVLVE